jgi:hypothetical protein
VERWIGVEDRIDPASDNDWSLLPFMALSDGAHAYVIIRVRILDQRLTLAAYSSVEEFSYFTLRHEATTADEKATSLFGISCSRQLDAKDLINRPTDVTRSTVQKAVVVIFDRPQYYGQLREKLSIVTKAWFAQRYIWTSRPNQRERLTWCRDFTDVAILEVHCYSITRSSFRSDLTRR